MSTPSSNPARDPHTLILRAGSRSIVDPRLSRRQMHRYVTEMRQLAQAALDAGVSINLYGMRRLVEALERTDRKLEAARAAGALTPEAEDVLFRQAFYLAQSIDAIITQAQRYMVGVVNTHQLPEPELHERMYAHFSRL